MSNNNEHLVVSSVHLYPYENSTLHHTDIFLALYGEDSPMVLRRAQPFKLTISFSGRGYDSEREVVELAFDFGTSPNIIKGTKVISTVTDSQRNDNNMWHSILERSEGNNVNVEVNDDDNDNGVVRGLWDDTGRYIGGINPTAWTGCVPILQQYLNTEKPVKYGQCFVFGAIVNTGAKVGRSSALRDGATRMYMQPSKSGEGVIFELSDFETVDLGDSFTVTLNIELLRKYLQRTNLYKIIYVLTEKTMTLEVTPEEYMDKLVEYYNMRVYAVATVLETNETWANEDNFKILTPKLNIQTASFGMKALVSDIQGGEEVVVEHQFIPQRSGELTLVGTFDSNELNDVSGAAMFNVA
ncbi:hypothetical protein C0J52_15977 [Blattella germanica]|nr:hypothetical protein C0J52_15977 [Blattella germanica]